MYWSQKRNTPVIVTWNFVKASKIKKKKVWWRKWRLFWGRRCHTSTEANQQVSVERASLPIRKPAFQTQRAFFLESSRSFHRPSCLSNQEWESSRSMVIKGNVLLSLKANRTNEIRMDFISTQSMASPGGLSEMQTLRLHTDLLSQNLYFRKIPKETSMYIHFEKFWIRLLVR